MKDRKASVSAGVALVIVLSFLVLISVIVVGFMSSVSTGLIQSKSTADSSTTQQLANSAVNVVMAQLVDATKGQDSQNALAWASQPGMIRTFDSTGTARHFYKLYSSDQMTVSGTSFDISKEVPPNDWNSISNSEIYTDLNAPIKNSQGNLIYPILDPLADGTTPPKPQSGFAKPFKVDGFSITASPGFVAGDAESTLNNRAPMPVKWLYVLKDGTLKAPSDPKDGKVVVKGATSTNPVVGRIAFWADDETAKVNINTASEGTYWDVPRIYSKEDFGQYSGTNVVIPGLSVCQPAQREYQRYPGHPATTCLSPIFGSVSLGSSALLPVSFPFGPFASKSAADTEARKLDPYYRIAPRIGLKTGDGGGSKGGSHQVLTNDLIVPSNLERDRLYASVDELMFTPGLTAGTPWSRIPNTSTTAAPKTITSDVMEKARFFLTASSAAPETTLNNTPRVAIWPVADTDGKRTAYDKLLAFCSTVGGKAYYFARSPGTGARDAAEFANVANGRNAILYQYLQTLTKTDVPGFGDNFLRKYGIGATGVSDRDQILTYICDYIRSTNLQDQSTAATVYTKIYPTLGAGEVIPLKIGQTQGFGRFLSVSSANLLFYGTQADASGKVNKMRAVFFVQFVTPMHGMAAKRSATKYIVTGLEKLQAKFGNESVSMNFEPAGTNRLAVTDLSIWHGRDVGGTEHAIQGLRKADGLTWPDSAAGKDSKTTGVYPFFSRTDITVPANQTNFSIPQPVDVKLEVWSDEDAGVAATKIQTFNFRFPEGTFKIPGIAGGTPYNFGLNRSFAGADGVRALVNDRDTIISLQVAGVAGDDPAKADDPTAGDTRMVASLIEVPVERFRAHNDYKTAGVQYAHGLTMSIGERYNKGTYGTLVASANYQNPGTWRQPDVPSRVPVNKGVQRKDGGPGDWDTGFGDQRDGAYINKPDEGDTALHDQIGTTRLPYMLGYGKGTAAATNVYFSPNRQIPSALTFGSVPTGVQRMRPWQTLAFHPRPEDPNHPGNLETPKDHLLADLFWMPVVEPYAISQPFATSGKINLNYQILPFTYINRATGLHAVMKSTKFMALPVADAPRYKPIDASANAHTVPENRRQPIDMERTLRAFDEMFKKGEIFRSATQICEMNLIPPPNSKLNPAVPDIKTSQQMAAFWNNYKLTGDNLREKPYVDIYPRLTTKSNTFTVHVRVQLLRKDPNSDPEEWLAGRDKVAGEYRGSSIIERYIDVNDPRLPDFARLFSQNPNDSKLNIDQYYRMRVVSTKRFNPR
jgi:uncharacterized protein (TIGR02600 family)